MDGEVIGAIGKGFLLLLGVSDTDTEQTADRWWIRYANCVSFEDENGKTNLSLADVGGALLVVSQFTLYADCKKGNRPSFIKAGGPKLAEELYEYVISRCRERVQMVEHGSFGAHMIIDLKMTDRLPWYSTAKNFNKRIVQ